MALTDDPATDTVQNLSVKCNVSDSGNSEKGLTVHLVRVTVATVFDRSLSKTSVQYLRVEGVCCFYPWNTHKVNS